MKRKNSLEDSDLVNYVSSKREQNYKCGIRREGSFLTLFNFVKERWDSLVGMDLKASELISY